MAFCNPLYWDDDWVVNGVAGLLSSLAQDYYFFLLLRFLSGIGVGGSIPVVWTYFAEFQPSNKRGAACSVLATFWMVGNITVAGIAWLIIPHDIGWSDPAYFQFNSWRIFVSVCALPSLLVAISLLWLPESPRYLLTKGKEEKSLSILRHMYIRNGGKIGGFPVTSLVVERMSDHIIKQKGDFLSTAKEALQQTLQLFSTPYLLRITSIMILINFSIQFGYYGLWLWFPELFNKLDQYYSVHPNNTVTVCQVIGMEVQSNTSSTSTSTSSCVEQIPDNQVFINSFLISLSAGPSNLWTIYHMDKLGRKFFLCLSMILSGGSAFLIYLVNSSSMNLIISCVFGAVSTMGFNSLDCLGVELFPTELRSTALAVTLVAARFGAILGNLVFGYLVESHCSIPILMVAALLMGGGMLSFFLPNTTGKSLS